MPTEAFVTGTPVIGITTSATGAVTGTIFAVTQKSGQAERALTLQLVFASAPGASVYRLFQSLNGIDFSQVGADITEAVPIIKNLINAKFVRLDQVSKTNAILATGSLMIA